MVKNEHGEVVDHRAVRDIAKRVRKLSKKEIEELWCGCGWVDSDKGENKALPPWRLNQIKEDQKSAEGQVYSLLMESPVEEVKKKLLEIENS